MDKTLCPKCRKIGLVRAEHVIKGDSWLKVYYCGACEHQWSEPDDRHPLTVTGAAAPPLPAVKRGTKRR